MIYDAERWRFLGEMPSENLSNPRLLGAELSEQDAKGEEPNTYLRAG